MGNKENFGKVFNIFGKELRDSKNKKNYIEEIICGEIYLTEKKNINNKYE